MKKRATKIKEGDVVVDRLGFLRTVVNIVTTPGKVVGWVKGLVYSDGGTEHYDFYKEVDVLEDERGH